MAGWLADIHDRIWVPPVPGPYDVMMCTHGYLMRPRLFYRGSQLAEVARWLTEAGRPTIAWFPAGRRRNWGIGLDPWREPKEAVEYVSRKFMRLKLKYGIDPLNNLYYLGFSKGAFFAGYFARYGGWDPTAVVMYAGGHVGDRPARQPYPVMLIRGTDDRMVPYEPQRALTEAQRWYLDHGHPVTVLEPDDTGHQWAEEVNPAVYKFLANAGRLRPSVDITVVPTPEGYIRSGEKLLGRMKEGESGGV